MINYDFRREQFSKKTKEIFLKNSQIYDFRAIKCEEYHHDLQKKNKWLGHCVIMTKGTKMFHLEIPKKDLFSQEIQIQHFFLFEEYLSFELPAVWSLSDNSIAFHAYKAVLMKENFVDPRTKILNLKKHT